MKQLKSRTALLLSIIFTIITLFAFIYYSDHKENIALPENIIPINQGITTAYIIKIPEGFLLFDTGYEKDYETFRKILKNKNIELSSIKYIFLSHHHDDHAGYLGKIIADSPKIKIIAHEKAVPLLASGKNNKGNGGGIINPLIYGLFRFKQIITPDWTLTFPPFKIRSGDLLVKDEVYSLKSLTGINAIAVYTPGHSSDSISLIIDNEYIMCGDAASNYLNWAGAYFLTLFNEDLNNIYKSWEYISALKVKYILPSHGKPFTIKMLIQNMNKYRQEDLVKFF
jgi:glyoxylase-like metal-dependent hydrolase (beta-lactamase superfamily II)